MKRVRFISGIACVFLLLAFQLQKDKVFICNSLGDLNNTLDVNFKNLSDSSSIGLKIYFTLKIDSLGEIHSAHIRWSSNFNTTMDYELCSFLETKVNVKFLYNEYFNSSFPSKYVYCNYPYSRKPDSVILRGPLLKEK